MKILVVDDEPLQRDMLSGFLRKNGYEVATADCAAAALDVVRSEAVPLVLLDHRMPDMNGDVLLARIHEINPMIKALMITAHGSIDTAVKVMKLGAVDFLEKPVDLKVLLETIQAIEQRLAVEADADSVTAAVDVARLPIRIVAESPAMKNVLSMVLRMAPSPWTVLIRGETGTGKELAARLLHMLSPRAEGPFVDVNCGAIPENLFESELFGHEKGAFTGASTRRRGRFLQANGGSLFLDEIGELPMALQPKLLRALQEKQIVPLGGEAAVDADGRVIAATNRDLDILVGEGKFREDLYYRLKVLDVEIPPLRHRKEDIPALIDFFIDRYATASTRLTPDALDVMMKYAFPGNVRELENIVQRTVTLARGTTIRAVDLPPELRMGDATADGPLQDRLATVEKQMIQAALDHADGVQTRAAEALGISERVLRYKLKKYGFDRTSGH